MKISVVVPTYNTDPKALSRLVDSIDKQTMNKEEYELIFVDDGSTTDIYDKLKELEESRTNVLTKRIPNSGWGSKPRNIGVNMAQGEYILFLDHDDYVFPEAFERVYEYGILNDADVVNGKEVRTKGWSWGWDNFKENNPSAEKMGIGSMLPMTPHKFYKRKFLLDNNITFNEGARVLWEDVYFNTKVFTRGAKVAVLSDYPTYHWISTGANSSSSFGRDPHEKWAQLRKLFTFFKETIKDENDLKYMIKHWYQSRVLGILGNWLLDKSEERINIEFNYAKKLAEDFVDESIDAEVTSINKPRAYLLRRGKIDELKLLAKYEQKITARSYVSEDIHWSNGKLVINAKTEMTYDEKELFKLQLEEHQIFKKIPDELKGELPEEVLNVTDCIKPSTYEASILGRDTRETWPVPVENAIVDVTPLNANEMKVFGEIDFKIDLDKAAMGRRLDQQPWDIAARFSALGYTFHRGLVAPKGLGKAALINGHTAVVYKNKSELLTIDIGSKVRSVVGTSKPKQSDIKYDNKDGQLTINLTNTHVHGSTKIKGHVLLENDDKNEISYKVPAYLIGDKSGARVTASIKLPKGKYWITTLFEGRKSNTKLYVDTLNTGIFKIKNWIGK
ncbi:glycosyltransferase family 2 protein [Lederbergia ruris]|uniref:glycosyltransferase family 2 protein n=1 Tax=Lederbergia ruris TaxID=217495 RepID=UPI0039A319F3